MGFLLFHEDLNHFPVAPGRLLHRFENDISVSVVEGSEVNSALHVLIAASITRDILELTASATLIGL